ncbi:antirestriction protein ArdA [Gordonia hydrophobica]|uniref:antirestriction protein ArdA n=1 Tax=Gordonia hydrophobica TaxID=40516 RepID=UPI000B2FE239|nr:hypothetical protein [Gordonia hydrophobica]
MSTTNIVEPTVWIGCLLCYNAGRLVGHWYGITEACEVDVATVHRGSGVRWRAEGCEELWCLDLDGLPVHHEMSPADAAAWGEVYEQVGEQWPAVAAWVPGGDYVAEGDGELPALGEFEDRYRGCWE